MIYEEITRWVLDEAPVPSELVSTMPYEPELWTGTLRSDDVDDGMLGIRSLYERPEVLLATEAHAKRRRGRRRTRYRSCRYRTARPDGL